MEGVGLGEPEKGLGDLSVWADSSRMYVILLHAILHMHMSD